jgi:hypothetical protein
MGFRNIKPGLDRVQMSRLQLLVYKMARPLATGDFWDDVRPRSFR